MQTFALRWLRHSHLVPPPVSPSALRADVRNRDAYAAESRPRSSNVHHPRGPIHLPVSPPHHSRLHGAECGSLCTLGHLSCGMAAVSGIQDHLASQSHPDPDRERPSASLVYEERDPGVRELRMLERVGMHLLCPSSASGNQWDKRHKKVKQNSKPVLQVVFSECLLFPYSSACYYSNIVRPTGLVG